MKKIYKVCEITSSIKKLLETNYSFLQVQGELSGVTYSASGHCYFRLKDHRAQVSCVCFRMSAKNTAFELKNGTEVIVSGRISLYEPQGGYQIIIEKIEPLGVGELQIRFEELKQKLQNQGFFDLSAKKTIPSLPKKIGLVTSLKGAALQDILTILKRRAPQIEILIANSLVQGANAESNLLAAVAILEKQDVALILIARGGGSMEDLWCFNSEELVKKIFSCSVPIISAIGHESDFTLCDLVADQRAATPSEAAEIISCNSVDLLEKIQSLENSLIRELQTKIKFFLQIIQKLTYQLGNPQHIMQNYLQRLDDISQRLEQNLLTSIDKAKNKLNTLNITLVGNTLLSRILLLKQTLAVKKEQITKLFYFLLQTKEKKFLALSSELKLQNPLRALEQGYAKISFPDGSAIKSIEQIQIKDLLQIEFSQGKAVTEVKQISKALPLA